MLNRVLPASLLAVALAAPPALGSIPGGTLPANFYEGIQHVCRDVEPGHKLYVECESQVGGDPQAEYTASECVAAGLPAVCVADYVPKARVKLVLTLVVDDDAKDGADGNDGLHAGVVLQGKYKGTKILLSELFFGSKIGNWNEFSEAELVALENILFADEAPEGATWEIVNQFSRENLVDVGDRLLELVDEKHKLDLAAEGVVAVITDVRPLPKKGAADETGSLVGSTSVYRVTIEFARVRN